MDGMWRAIEGKNGSVLSWTKKDKERGVVPLKNESSVTQAARLRGLGYRWTQESGTQKRGLGWSGTSENYTLEASAISLSQALLARRVGLSRLHSALFSFCNSWPALGVFTTYFKAPGLIFWTGFWSIHWEGAVHTDFLSVQPHHYPTPRPGKTSAVIVTFCMWRGLYWIMHVLGEKKNMCVGVHVCVYTCIYMYIFSFLSKSMLSQN